MQRFLDYFSETEMSQRNGVSASISIKDWLFLELLTLVMVIPVLGTILYIILYAVIGFRHETATSMGNFIKLNLIISIIVMLFLFVVGAIIGGVASIFTFLS